MYIDLTIEEAKELIDLIRGGNKEEPKKRRKERNEEENVGFGKGKGIT